MPLVTFVNPNWSNQGRSNTSVTRDFEIRGSFLPPLPVIDVVAGPMEPETKEQSPFEYFKLYVSGDMIQFIVMETNIYALDKTE